MLAKLPVVLATILLGLLADAQSTMRVSLDSSGVQGNFPSRQPSLSGDGRFVAFQSDASNLVPGDTLGSTDVFVHDLQTGQTTRASVDSSGIQGNGPSYFPPSISADGRFVAFVSYSTNLVPGDTNNEYDIFVHDMQTGQTRRVNVSSAGAQSNAPSDSPSISANGQFVVFDSRASTLVPGSNGGGVFVHDVQTGQTTCASVSSAGAQANGDSVQGAISADGLFVAFQSDATNLVLGDTNTLDDIFVHDQQTGQTSRVSVGSTGVEGIGESREPCISADGRFVAFMSYASNLVPGDTNGVLDIFVHDRQSGTTERMSVDSGGVQGDSYSTHPSISANGRFVAFHSYAGNLVPGDTNGTYDIFVHDRQTGQTSRVSVESQGVQGNYDSIWPAVSADGRFVAFESAANNLVPADTNGQLDVFVRDWWHPCFVDDDLDGVGVGVPTFSPGPCGPGYAGVDGDCNDADPAIHPGAPDICNGIDDNCDGVIDEGFIYSYCTAGTTVHGCVPSIAGLGTPSSTATSGFQIVVSGVPALQSGTIFYGFYPVAVPWSPGSPSYRCVSLPIQRTQILNSSGGPSACNGVLQLDFNAWITANPSAMGLPATAGQVFYVQGWFRDNGAPKGSNMSNALRFTMCN